MQSERISPRTSGRKCEAQQCREIARYECPRCAIAYCSVPCYRVHSERCVTAFESTIAENLRGIYATETEKSRMQEVLNRIREFDNADHSASELGECPDGAEQQPEEWDIQPEMSDDGRDSDEERSENSSQDSESSSDGDNSGDEDIGDDVDADERQLQETMLLEQLLDDLNDERVDYEDALERLPTDLCKEFQQQVRDGRISRFLPLWTPWWQGKQSSNHLDVSDSEDDAEWNDSDPKRAKDDSPRLPLPQNMTLAPESALKIASNRLVFSVLNATASYCTVMRQCNGNWSQSASATFNTFWSRSGALAKDERYASVAESATAFLHNGQVSTDLALEALQDTAAIFNKQEHLSRAMFDARNMLEKARDGHSDRDHLEHWHSRTLAAAEKKLGFFVSWACAVPESQLWTAADILMEFVADRRRSQADAMGNTAQSVADFGKLGARCEVQAVE